jgi:hypothetical protein
VGTWTNTADRTDSVPKIDVLMDGEVLKVRFWGRTHPQDSPFGPPDPLHVLSPYGDGGPHPAVAAGARAVAFATHKSDFAMHYSTLTLREQVLHLDMVTIFTDGSGRSDRTYHATFAKR